MTPPAARSDVTSDLVALLHVARRLNVTNCGFGFATFALRVSVGRSGRSGVSSPFVVKTD